MARGNARAMLSQSCAGVIVSALAAITRHRTVVTRRVFHQRAMGEHAGRLRISVRIDPGLAPRRDSSGGVRGPLGEHSTWKILRHAPRSQPRETCEARGELFLAGAGRGESVSARRIQQQEPRNSIREHCRVTRGNQSPERARDDDRTANSEYAEKRLQRSSVVACPGGFRLDRIRITVARRVPGDRPEFRCEALELLHPRAGLAPDAVQKYKARRACASLPIGHRAARGRNPRDRIRIEQRIHDGEVGSCHERLIFASGWSGG